MVLLQSFPIPEHLQDHLWLPNVKITNRQPFYTVVLTMILMFHGFLILVVGEVQIVWVRLFSAKIFRISSYHFEFLILWYRNIIALAFLIVVKDHVVLEIAASAKGAQT